MGCPEPIEVVSGEGEVDDGGVQFEAAEKVPQAALWQPDVHSVGLFVGEFWWVTMAVVAKECGESLGDESD